MTTRFSCQSFLQPTFELSNKVLLVILDSCRSRVLWKKHHSNAFLVVPLSSWGNTSGWKGVMGPPASVGVCFPWTDEKEVHFLKAQERYCQLRNHGFFCFFQTKQVSWKAFVIILCWWHSFWDESVEYSERQCICVPWMSSQLVPWLAELNHHTCNDLQWKNI